MRILAADPSPEPSSVYWPHRAGLEWTYRDDRGHEWSLRVASEEALRGERLVALERRDGDVLTTRYFAVRPEGILLVAAKDPRLQQGELSWLPFPTMTWPATVQVGQAWRVYPDQPGNAQERRVQGWESVTVPAGTFEALIVRSKTPSGVMVTEWVARNVGVVKSRMAWPNGASITSELVASNAIVSAQPPADP